MRGEIGNLVVPAVHAAATDGIRVRRVWSDTSSEQHLLERRDTLSQRVAESPRNRRTVAGSVGIAERMRVVFV
jgi:hypothetical protein